MNRQAFTFLTLFSLVLMLTVYYVTLPVENTSDLDPNTLIASVENTGDGYNALLKAVTEKRSILTEQYNAILASSESSETAKHEALLKLNELETLRVSETALESMLEEKGYEGCFVEIAEETIHITCQKQYKNNQDAAKIIAEIQKSAERNVTVEVSFE